MLKNCCKNSPTSFIHRVCHHYGSWEETSWCPSPVRPPRQMSMNMVWTWVTGQMFWTWSNYGIQHGHHATLLSVYHTKLLVEMGQQLDSGVPDLILLEIATHAAANPSKEELRGGPFWLSNPKPPPHILSTSFPVVHSSSSGFQRGVVGCAPSQIFISWTAISGDTDSQCSHSQGCVELHVQMIYLLQSTSRVHNSAFIFILHWNLSRLLIRAMLSLLSCFGDGILPNCSHPVARFSLPQSGSTSQIGITDEGESIGP